MDMAEKVMQDAADRVTKKIAEKEPQNIKKN